MICILVAYGQKDACEVVCRGLDAGDRNQPTHPFPGVQRSMGCQTLPQKHIKTSAEGLKGARDCGKDLMHEINILKSVKIRL